MRRSAREIGLVEREFFFTHPQPSTHYISRNRPTIESLRSSTSPPLIIILSTKVHQFNFTFYKNWIQPPSDHETAKLREKRNDQLQCNCNYTSPMWCVVCICVRRALLTNKLTKLSQSQAMQVENDWKSRLCDFSLCSDRTTDRRSGNVPACMRWYKRRKLQYIVFIHCSQRYEY